MELEIIKIISSITKDEDIERSLIPKRSKYCKTIYNSNSILLNTIWKETQKELLKDLIFHIEDEISPKFGDSKEILDNLKNKLVNLEI